MPVLLETDPLEGRQGGGDVPSPPKPPVNYEDEAQRS
jgi:hypothetical protein